MANNLLLLLVFGWGLVSVFIAMHASGNRKTKLWGLIVFIFGIFGLVFYAISLAGNSNQQYQHNDY